MRRLVTEAKDVRGNDMYTRATAVLDDACEPEVGCEIPWDREQTSRGGEDAMGQM